MSQILVASCHVCMQPTTEIVSKDIPDCPPLHPNDAIAICPQCKPDWNLALFAILDLK